MEKMILIIMLGVLFISIFSGVLVDKCSAEEPYILSMDDPTYEFVSSLEVGGRIYVTFNINVILHNSGAVVTPIIIVKILDDDEIPMYRNGTISPGDSTSFLFNDVIFRPVEGKNEYNAYISYYPDVTDAANENQGETTLILKISDLKDGSSTPGFEIVFLFE